MKSHSFVQQGVVVFLVIVCLCASTGMLIIMLHIVVAPFLPLLSNIKKKNVSRLDLNKYINASSTVLYH